MSFFKKERSGPKVGGDCNHGGGIAGAQGEILNPKFIIDGGGPQAQPTNPVSKNKLN